MTESNLLKSTLTADILDNVRCADRWHFQKLLSDIQRRRQRGQPFDRLLTKLELSIAESRAWVELRQSRLGRIEYPQQLPVVEHKEEIAKAISEHQVVILAGETGSGKTTQLPKICLELGRGSRGLIGHTQPRRLAARTVANRIAEELDSEIGDLVGYQVRFTDKVSDNTSVKLMTDGILLAEIQQDKYLSRYDTLIIDEAHERSLNIDFLLGYLKQLLPRRPDLKLIVTSATIDVARFSAHFSGAPVLEVSGRTYPVEVVYRERDADAETDDLAAAVFSALDEIESMEVSGHSASRGGDVLVFLSGERDIRELSKQFRHRDKADIEVLPLYARLSNAEQNRVFNTGKRRGRRIVLATNVAETSLTVPGIRYVIDPGFARISRYSHRSKVQRLPIEAISQASANQRKGRCGRLADGICIRLYSEQDFVSRPEFTDPEIQRTNLAAVILQMLNLRLGDIEKFPFIDAPDSKMIRDGYKLLEELGAVDARGKLTSDGRKLARLPVDPRIGRMVLAGSENNSLQELLVIASALSVQDPRERPADKQQAADEKHRRFWDEQSDFVAYVNLWNYYELQRQQLSQNQLRKLGQREFLSFLKMREWREIHHQLTVACRQLGFKLNTDPADYARIHKALLAGLLSHVANWYEDRDYLGARNRKLQIFPGSSQTKKKPKWLLAAEIVETSRIFARTVAKIEPQWILGINDSLLKKHYYEPHWQMRSGRVMAFERISLYGLIVSDKHKVHYGPIDSEESRRIMIRSALVENRCKQSIGFMRHNLQLLQELEQLEAKFRRKDIVASEQVLYEYYDRHIPHNIFTIRALQSWLKKTPGADDSLKLNRADLLLREPDSSEQAQFPDHIDWQDMSFKLAYHFEPGHPRDGVSVTVPIGLMNRMPRHRFEWLVPGLLREKCVQMLKSLPKSIRKNFVPVPDYVDKALADYEPEDRPLTDFLTERLQNLVGAKLDRAMWANIELDDYYRLNFIVVDAQSQVLAEGRDLNRLLDICKDQLSELVSSGGGDQFTRGDITRWDFEELPERVDFMQAGVEIRAYPAMVSYGNSVALELMDYPQQAAHKSHKGVVTLMRLHCAEQVRFLRKNFLKGNQVTLRMAGCGLQREPLIEDMIDAVFYQAMLNGRALPRTQAEFSERMIKGRADLVNIANEYEKLLANTIEFYAAVVIKLEQFKAEAWQYAHEDIKRQIAALIYPNFLLYTDFEYLKHYPRYFKAVDIRLQRLSGQYKKDLHNAELLGMMAEKIEEQQQRDGDILFHNAQLQKYRWMMEEYRVSLFAQSLGTSMAVSEKRLLQQWQLFEAGAK